MSNPYAYYIAICERGLDEPAPYLVPDVLFNVATIIVALLSLAKGRL